jgi:hypothetical protein
VTKIAILDKNKHKNTRILTERGAEFGENVHLIPVIADELEKLVLEYPVCLIKDNDTGQFGLHALLGFEVNENLFLQGNEWQASYVPLHIKRQPFMVGVNAKHGEQPTPENTIITINTANARVQELSGEAIFDDKGNATPFMQEMNNLLSNLMNGIIRTEAFIQKLSEHNLIESIQLTVNFIGSEEKRFDGIYTINEENLQQLSADVLEELNNKGYLQACYLLRASIGHVQKLISLKRKQLSADSDK